MNNSYFCEGKYKKKFDKIFTVDDWKYTSPPMHINFSYSPNVNGDLMMMNDNEILWLNNI